MSLTAKLIPDDLRPVYDKVLSGTRISRTRPPMTCCSWPDGPGRDRWTSRGLFVDSERTPSDVRSDDCSVWPTRLSFALL